MLCITLSMLLKVIFFSLKESLKSTSSLELLSQFVERQARDVFEINLIPTRTFGVVSSRCGGGADAKRPLAEALERGNLP